MVGDHGIRDKGRQPFDQIDMIPFDDGYDPLGDAAVVDRIVQVVAGAGARQVKVQHGIDDERLRALMLIVQHAVRAHALNAGEANRVHDYVLSHTLS